MSTKPTLDMIGLITWDLPKSVEFYRLLGLDIPEMEADEPYVEATLPSGIRVSWNKIEMVRQIYPGMEDPVGHRMGMAFLCDSPGRVDSLYQEIVSAGYDGVKQPFDAFWGQRYAVIKDPDGNLVDLFAPMTQ